MKATELRIGNYLSQDKLLNGDDYCVVYELLNDRVITKSKTLTGVIYEQTEKYIPLTEEWLLKLGFEYCEFPSADEDGVYRDKNEVNKEYFKHPRLSEEICYYLPYKNFDYHIGSMVVEHVHQLQNIYFALTGEELTIK